MKTILIFVLGVFLGIVAHNFTQSCFSASCCKIHCICGCTETGSCTCKDCDHPKLK